MKDAITGPRDLRLSAAALRMNSTPDVPEVQLIHAWAPPEVSLVMLGVRSVAVGSYSPPTSCRPVALAAASAEARPACPYAVVSARKPTLPTFFFFSQSNIDRTTRSVDSVVANVVADSDAGETIGFAASVDMKNTPAPCRIGFIASAMPLDVPPPTTTSTLSCCTRRRVWETACAVSPAGS